MGISGINVFIFQIVWKFDLTEFIKKESFHVIFECKDLDESMFMSFDSCGLSSSINQLFFYTSI